jgi:hypothetical protein
MKRSYSRWLMLSATLGLLAPGYWFLARRLDAARILSWDATYPLELVIRVV